MTEMTTATRIQLLRAAVRELAATQLIVQGLYIQVSGEPEWKEARVEWEDHEYTVLSHVVNATPPLASLANAMQAYLSPGGPDDYDLCSTAEEFEAWCKEGGWKGAEDFTDSTGVAFEELQGQRFQVVHNRVFLEYEGPSRGIA